MKKIHLIIVLFLMAQIASAQTDKIGIGSITPDSMLTVSGGGRFTGGLRVGGVAQASTILGSTSPGGSLTLTASNSSTAPSFWDNAFILKGGTNGSRTLMQILHGTSSPVIGIPTIYAGDYALNVTGTIITDNIVARNAGGSLPQANFWNTTNNQTAAYFNFQKSRGDATAIVQNGDEVGNFGFGASNGTSALYSQAQMKGIVSGTPVSGGLVPVDFIFYTSASATSGVPNLSERMRLTYTGNVGIGTSTPTSTLHVNGSLSRGAPVTVTAATHTVAETTSWIICNRAGAVTLTLPTASSFVGREIMVKTVQAQAVNSASANVVGIATTSAGTSILSGTAGAWATLVSDGTNWIVMQRGQ